MVMLPPRRRAVRAESIAVLPAPMTITCSPCVSGSGVVVGESPCTRLTRVRKLLADITLIRRRRERS